jgi:hypothetical protein
MLNDVFAHDITSLYEPRWLQVNSSSLIVEATKISSEWEQDEAVEFAHVALQSPSHKAEVENNIKQLLSTIQDMERKSNELINLDYTTSSNLRILEGLGEELDHELHLLQYKIDRCRR